MERLRFDGYDIVFQEIPDEISLAINITECPHHCVGCHSAYLAESYGEYVDEKLPELLSQYGDMISCVCFMGGDQHIEDFKKQCQYIHTTFPTIKIAIYTGTDYVTVLESCFDYLDYIKVGHYDNSRGGLNRPTTNQRIYKKENGRWSDITYRFWNIHKEM